jgi:lauroyl/myristoyl acyltransferase
MLRLASLLPLSLLYALCGMLAWLLRVAGWRRRLVTDGLGRCLADRDPAERRAIAREFYAGLGRLVAEFLRSPRMTPAEFEITRHLRPGRNLPRLHGHLPAQGPLPRDQRV